ncbi:hypothetical protein BKA65DRAFT_196244 [Rhexocercosporidium sp. MPI-PUGE-AT-0058]|nr:hypothetical protein BKA65DRAFT_196244 [Rhexocercosporidium sp. MPI-PUGE-AT-0058]
MEQFIALEGPILDLAACHSQGTIEKTVPLPHEPQGFEWIPHGDASARKRARAHVTRGFRRQKAAQAQLLKSGSECGKASKRDSSVGSQESAIATVVKGIRASQPREGSDVDDSAKTLLQGIVLQKTLGPDPFAAFPVRLSPDKQELLDHFFFGLAPLSFVGDNRADFQPVKKLVFNMGLLGAPGFHVILAAAANDIAAARGIRTSEAGLKHQRIAIALVNKKLSEWKPDSSNESLASVALLAGLELLFGTPQNFNTHMDGLTVMLKLRGGLECLRDKDPQVYSIISWFDYAGSCNLVSRRRFESTEYPDRLHSNPEGVPVKIISSLPAGYDLYQELMCTFDRLHTMTAAIRSADTTDEQRLDISVALDRVDAALYESICILDTEFNRSRRRHLQESICLLTMVYTSLVSEYEGPQTEIFIYRFEKIWTGEGCEWGSIIIGIFRSLLVGEGYHSEVFMHRVLRLVDVSTKIAWAGWRHIKEVLMAFFVWDPACHGQLQDIWKDRMEPISPLKEML